MALHADVSVQDDVEAMVAATVERWGRLDVLYNNAAVQMSGRLVECSEAEWDLTIATNLDAVFWACRAALPAMLDGEGGSIINTASVLGLIGSEGYVAYGAAKAGLVALTRQIAVEYGPTVRANVIAPGSIDTPRFQKVAEEMDDPEGFLDGLAKTIPLHRLGHGRGRGRHRPVPGQRPVGLRVRRGHPGRRRPGGVPMSRVADRHGRGVGPGRARSASSWPTTASWWSSPTWTARPRRAVAGRIERGGRRGRRPGRRRRRSAWSSRPSTSGR